MEKLVRKLTSLLLIVITLFSFSIATPALAESTNYIVSQQEIASAASQYGISPSSNAFAALQLINSYYDRLSSSLSATLVFFFEGVGNNSSPSARMNAMCVVIKDGRIKYINRNSSTIPDYPFDPQKNENKDMPTIKSGVHNFTTVNHKGQYAALNITAAPVIRHSSRNYYYNGTSDGINIHRRSRDSIPGYSESWVNSSGCLIVGVTPNTNSTTSEYANFIKTVGIVGQSATANSTYSNYVTGKVVVDRSFAYEYLSGVGYTSGAISALGTTYSCYRLDLNCTDNDSYLYNISGIATADVYINGQLVSNDCDDHWVSYPAGTTYTITDIKPQMGYSYVGQSTITGTINSDTCVVLPFRRILPSFYLDINCNVDGQYINNISGIATADVYINGCLVANDCTDYWVSHPLGTMYTITDIKPMAGYAYTGPSTISGILYNTCYNDLTFTRTSNTNSFRMKSGAYTNAYDGVNGTKVGRVYPGDVVTVQAVYPSGWLKLSCPWTGGVDKIVHVRASEFKFKATQYINAYNGVNGTKVGRVYPNDLVTVIEVYSSGWMKCDCPWTGNTVKTIYIKTSEIY